MTQFGTLIVGIVLTFTFLTQGSKDAVADLQGTWVMTSIKGQPIPDAAPQLRVTFTGDKYEQRLNGEVNERGTIRMDASKKPATIDFVITEGEDAGKTQLGIIEVTGDTMRASLAEPAAPERPADFVAKDGVLLFEAKKVQR